MRLLLDTHILLWSITASERMPQKGAERVQSDKAQLFCSAASIWEVGIKHAKGQKSADPMPMSGADLLEQLQLLDVEIIAMTAQHSARAAQLSPHHADPFDRMLIAQAQLDDFKLLTSDKQLAAYGDFVMLV